MKKPHPSKKDPRRERAAEFWRQLTPAGLQAFLESATLENFRSVNDAIACYGMREAREMRIDFVRVTYTAASLLVTDLRHNGPVFYVETPEFLRAFARAAVPASNYTGATLLPVLRRSLGLPAVPFMERGAA